MISGCATTYINPLCLPDRQLTEGITVDEQWYIRQHDENGDLLRKVGENDAILKSHITTIERITEEHNAQFKASCY